MIANEKVYVTEAQDVWIESRPVEIVERKGTGHPDTLCDGMAERISRAYSQWCLQHVGTLLHHNFDKVQLVAGAVTVTFGGGQVLKPMRVQIAGRGTTETPAGEPIPLDVLAIQAARHHLQETVRHLDVDTHCVITPYVGQGSSELVQTVQQVTANDTSVGVAHWPLSMLEEAVYRTTDYLNEELLHELPIGEDVKVMGLRLDGKIRLTCAVPFLARQVAGPAQYREAKAAVQQAIARYASDVAGREVTVDVNMADSEDGADATAYLTLTGTSGECGDDGAVGRGNRITGLITPFRASSLEAAAGKNPVSHVGKLYNVLALQAAQEIVAQVPGIREAQVILLSQIGRPLDEPLVAQIALRRQKGELTRERRQEVLAVLEKQLEDIDQLRQEIVDGHRPLF